MKRIILLLFTIIIISSCCNNDFTISDKYLIELNSFEKGEIIYFESNLKDIDTIKIVGVDYNEYCGTFGMSQAYSEMNLRIEHLPKNHWISETIFSENGTTKILNQSLINITKSNGSENIVTSVNFRNFYFYDLKINKTDSIQLLNSGSKIVNNNPESIDKIYWSNKFGITGYMKKNGQIYRRKNMP